MPGRIVREDVAAILTAPLPWERLKGKRVLVTGAAGFLAGYIVEMLLALGDVEVIGLVRNLDKARARFGDRVTLIADDINAPLRFQPKLDIIIHAASQASPKYYNLDPVGTALPNILGTQHLLDRARADKSDAFLFVSSGEVYGQVAGDGPIAEDAYGYLDPATVRACYGEAKRMGETLCVAAARQHGVPAFIVRPFHTYGPGIRLDDGRVFADFVADIVARRDITVKGDGAPRRAFCYASDAIAGLFTVLLTGQCATPYNLGNDEACASIRELAETLAATFPERGLAVRFDATKASPNYAKSPVSSNCPSVMRLRALGWHPRIGIAEGFRRSVAAVEEAPQTET
jgi:nucleoside-diphosphate-sugar epimerase